MTQRAAPLLLLVLAAAVYLWRLDQAPIYLAPDEVIIANDAHALATTAHTVDGQWLPLFFYVPLSASWFMPAIYYWTAPFLYLLPLAEWSIRLPTVVIAIVSIDEQPDVRLVTNLVGIDPDDVRIGMPVEVTFEDHDPVFLPLFRPVTTA